MKREEGWNCPEDDEINHHFFIILDFSYRVAKILHQLSKKV